MSHRYRSRCASAKEHALKRFTWVRPSAELPLKAKGITNRKHQCVVQWRPFGLKRLPIDDGDRLAFAEQHVPRPEITLHGCHRNLFMPKRRHGRSKFFDHCILFRSAALNFQILSSDLAYRYMFRKRCSVKVSQPIESQLKMFGDLIS